MKGRLDPKAYAGLRDQVQRRDAWRCQRCGSLQGVEVHHLEHRSQGGGDLQQNLICLCHRCHKSAHSARRIGFEIEDVIENDRGRNKYFSKE